MDFSITHAGFDHQPSPTTVSPWAIYFLSLPPVSGSGRPGKQCLIYGGDVSVKWSDVENEFRRAQVMLVC